MCFHFTSISYQHLRVQQCQQPIYCVNCRQYYFTIVNTIFIQTIILCHFFALKKTSLFDAIETIPTDDMISNCVSQIGNLIKISRSHTLPLRERWRIRNKARYRHTI